MEKIYELLRNLQKETEGFNNDFGSGDFWINDFTVTVLAHISEIMEELENAT
jgi:hypothetical protein